MLYPQRPIQARSRSTENKTATGDTPADAATNGHRAARI